MGHEHSHGDDAHGSVGHNHATGANARSLALALAITGTFLLAELAGAFWFNSLALLSDAAHMFTDVKASGARSSRSRSVPSACSSSPASASWGT